MDVDPHNFWDISITRNLWYTVRKKHLTESKQHHEGQETAPGSHDSVSNELTLPGCSFLRTFPLPATMNDPPSPMLINSPGFRANNEYWPWWLVNQEYGLISWTAVLYIYI